MRALFRPALVGIFVSASVALAQSDSTLPRLSLADVTVLESGAETLAFNSILDALALEFVSPAPDAQVHAVIIEGGEVVASFKIELEGLDDIASGTGPISLRGRVSPDANGKRLDVSYPLGDAVVRPTRPRKQSLTANELELFAKAEIPGSGILLIPASNAMFGEGVVIFDDRS
ncbi:MAG: hypothetical protein AAF618_15150 [Pseudomonadota bacterium]